MEHLGDDRPLSLPTSLVSGQGESPYPALALEINQSCGNRHAVLNQAITSAMPRGLPPQARDTLLYAHGLASFGTIYFSFEKAWNSFLRDEAAVMDAEDKHAQAVYDFFLKLRPDGLQRSPRLQKDLDYLFAPGEADTADGVRKIKHKELPAERAFRKHIQKSIAAKPHLLYAYAWCMYMAVFAGGRYIREWLAEFGDDFWTHHGISSPSTENPLTTADNDKDRLGFSFLSFDGTDDGESLQAGFKANLCAAEKIFTTQERREVVAEAKELYDLTIVLVKEMAQLITPPAARTCSLPTAPPAYSTPSVHSTALPAYSASLTRAEREQDEREGLLPTYSEASTDDLANAEKGFRDSLSLLRQQATDEEWREWRSEAHVHRGFCFWVQFVLFVAFLSVIAIGGLMAVRLWVARASSDHMHAYFHAADNLKPCKGWLGFQS